MAGSHVNDTYPSRYRPILSNARRDADHSSTAYGARGPTPQSAKWAITLRAARDFPPGHHNGSLKYGEYDGVAVAAPDRKIPDSGTDGYR